MNQNKKIISLLLILLTGAPRIALPAPEAGVSQKPAHYLLLIHGIGGSKKHFRYMGEALTEVLNQKNPSVHYLFKHIEYETGNNQKTPYDFARDLHVEIQKILSSTEFKPGDKISLIMHSQGGLIGAIWLFQSMMARPGYGTSETINHVDAFITLGTPFWGAKSARWGSDLKNLAGFVGADIPLPYGRRELEEMSFGSDTIFDFRNALIDPGYRPYFDGLKTKVRFLNIAGTASLLNPLGIFVSGTPRYEDDGAVPLASARFNFLYNQSLKENYEDGDRVAVDNVKELDAAPYVVVNAMHRSPLPSLPGFAGIIQVPKACAKNADCSHPTFTYLWKHILGEEIKQKNAVSGQFKTFLIDLNVRTPKEKDYDCSDLKIEMTRPDGSKLKEAGIHMLKFYELYAKGARHSVKYPHHCRFYFMGSKAGKDGDILIKISGRNLKTRFVEMKVKESYSSYVDINLEAAPPRIE